jgi:hypothetical protein
VTCISTAVVTFVFAAGLERVRLDGRRNGRARKIGAAAAETFRWADPTKLYKPCNLPSKTMELSRRIAYLTAKKGKHIFDMTHESRGQKMWITFVKD